jgi:hypothetical protein
METYDIDITQEFDKYLDDNGTGGTLEEIFPKFLATVEDPDQVYYSVTFSPAMDYDRDMVKYYASEVCVYRRKVVDDSRRLELLKERRKKALFQYGLKSKDADGIEADLKRKREELARRRDLYPKLMQDLADIAGDPNRWPEAAKLMDRAKAEDPEVTQKEMGELSKKADIIYRELRERNEEASSLYREIQWLENKA